MNLLRKLVLLIGFIALLQGSTNVYKEVEQINKGLDGYIIGKKLTPTQELIAKKNTLKSNNDKVVKFLVNKNMVVVVNKSNRKVLAINKRLQNMKQKDIKKLLGDYIYDYDEPTAMAHDKMVYWIYDEHGKKLTEDDLKAWKNSLVVKRSQTKTLAEAVKVKGKKVDFNPYVSIKLSSTSPIMTKQKNPKVATVNIIVSSDKLIQETTGVVIGSK